MRAPNQSWPAHIQTAEISELTSMQLYTKRPVGPFFHPSPPQSESWFFDWFTKLQINSRHCSFSRVFPQFGYFCSLDKCWLANILVDHQVTIRMSKNYKVTSINCHIASRWHFVCCGVHDNLFTLQWIPGHDQLADDCTKTQAASQSIPHFSQTLIKVPDKVKGHRGNILGIRQHQSIGGVIEYQHYTCSLTSNPSVVKWTILYRIWYLSFYFKMTQNFTTQYFAIVFKWSYLDSCWK